jgi:hypothetical protein
MTVYLFTMTAQQTGVYSEGADRDTAQPDVSESDGDESAVRPTTRQQSETL